MTTPDPAAPLTQGQRLRAAREFLGLSVEEVASLAGISNSAVAYYEGPVGGPPRSLLWAFATAFRRYLEAPD